MRVRVIGKVERHPDLAMWRVKCNNGTYTSWCTYDEAKRHCDYINNEDSEGEYFEVPDPPTRQYLDEDELEAAKKRQEEQEAAERRRERERKEAERIVKNRKSKRADKSYIYVISLVVRRRGDTSYFAGETNLMKMDRQHPFASLNIKLAKRFKTKASAQKIVDTLEKNTLINLLFRNIRVVQKSKKLFEE